MPIAKIQLEDGRIAKFEVPEGTTEAEVLQFVQDNRSQFDAPAIDQPVDQAAPQEVAPQQSIDSKELMSQLRIAQSMGDMEKVNKILPLLQPALDEDRNAAADFIKGIPAAVPTILSSAVAAPLSGLEGLGQEMLNPVRRLMGADEVSGADAVKRMQDRLTIDPVSESGAKTLATAGKVLEPIASLPGKAGEATFDLTGSPLAATAVESGATILPELIGLKGFSSFKKAASAKRLKSSVKADIPDNSIIKSLDDMSGVTIKETPTKDLINAAIKQGDADVAYLGKTVRSGKIVNNPFVKEAVAQGLDPKVLRSIETANPATKKAYIRAFKTFKNRRKNADFAATHRSSDVMGDAVNQRYQQLNLKRQQIGKKIGDYVKNDIAQKPIDVKIEIGSFLDDMKELGVTMVPDEKTGRIAPDVSQLDAMSTGGTQTIVQKILDRASGEMTVKKAHSIKKLIDDAVDFGKPPTAETALPSTVDHALKNLRAKVNKKIGIDYPRYGKLNAKYSEIIDPFSEMDKVFKSMLNISDPQAIASGIGTKAARTLMSNNAGRAAMLSVLKNADEVLKKNGVRFKDDLVKQAVYIDELERVFGSEATTSLGGATTRAIEDAAINAAFGDTGAAATGLLKGGYKKLKGINEENAIKAFEAMLK